MVAGMCDTRAEGADAQAPLRELCHAMLGPLSARVEGGVDGDWAASVAGLEKRVLLRETVFPALAANRACQRLVGEMDELLEVAEKRAGEKRREERRATERGWKARHL